MDYLTEKLRLWGTVHAQARSARQMATQPGEGTGSDRERDARRLEQKANRLHREIYAQIGRKGRPPT